MKTVHCMKVNCSHYCGRPTSLKRAKGDPVDLSILGNPHWYIKDRSESISAYAKYILDRIKTDKHFREVLVNIPDDATLGCFCYPDECHVDVIIEVSKYLKSKNEIFK